MKNDGDVLSVGDVRPIGHASVGQARIRGLTNPFNALKYGFRDELPFKDAGNWTCIILQTDESVGCQSSRCAEVRGMCLCRFGDCHDQTSVGR